MMDRIRPVHTTTVWIIINGICPIFLRTSPVHSHRRTLRDINDYCISLILAFSGPRLRCDIALCPARLEAPKRGAKKPC